MRSFLLMLAIMLTGFSPGAFASDFNGFVTGIFVISGKAFVALSGGSFNGPLSPCSAASDSAYYMIDLDSSFGKIQYSNALAAKVTGHRAYIHGDNSCNGNAYGPVGAEIMLGIDLRAD